MTDLGEKIFCRVIGSNVYGADTAYSNVVGPVTSGVIGDPPVNAGGIDAPDVTGTTAADQVLHCDRGVWSGTAPISYAYQWYQRSEEEPPPPSGDTLTVYGAALTVDGEELVT